MEAMHNIDTGLGLPNNAVWSLPVELQLMVLELILQAHTPHALAGIDRERPVRHVLLGDCDAYRQCGYWTPAMCQLESRIGDMAMTQYLKQFRNQFTLCLTNFDAHTLEHAMTAMVDHVRRSGGTLHSLEVYFEGSGRCLMLSNLVKWAVIYYRFAKHLSSRVDFCASLFCDAKGAFRYMHEEDTLLRAIAHLSLQGHEVPELVTALTRLILDFVTKVDISTPSLRTYAELRCLLRCEDPVELVSTLWSRFDPSRAECWHDAWGRHCKLHRMPTPWDPPTTTPVGKFTKSKRKTTLSARKRPAWRLH